MTLVVQGAILPVALSPKPSLTVWSRLEPLPTSADLRPGLQARIADPLWLLGRQWQFGEFQAEDGGSPIETRVRGEAVPLGRYAPGAPDAQVAARARDYAQTPLPLEVLVEREPARARHARLAAEAGIQFFRYLADEGMASQRARFQSAARYRLDDAAVDPASSPDGAAWSALLAGRALDGRKLAAAFRPLANANYVLSSLPADPAIAAAAAPAVRRAAGRWLRWYDEAITEPLEQPQSWNPARQEYAFALSAMVKEGPVVLVADEYRDGRIDWHTFRAASQPALGEPAAPIAPIEVAAPPMLPVPVRYPGMPADRYWEFEDARVNLADLSAGRTDLVQMLLVEFALAYGNDWFVIPLALPVGSLFRVTMCTVRDTFGVDVPVTRSRDAGGGVPWSMFELSTDPGAPDYLRDLFFLAPTLPLPLVSDPVEQVALFRDEMANVCWGVERRVLGPAGETVDRYLEAARKPVHQRMVDPPPDARLVYRLASPVPEHWIPFVPVPATANGAPAGVQLERRVLLRFDQTGASSAVHPRGLLLRSDPSLPADAEPPLRLHEEEVPREGALVERAFQYARGTRGESFLWLGRDKRVGSGEGASLLRHDTPERIGRR